MPQFKIECIPLARCSDASLTHTLRRAVTISNHQMILLSFFQLSDDIKGYRLADW
mgnify:FL=1